MGDINAILLIIAFLQVVNILLIIHIGNSGSSIKDILNIMTKDIIKIKEDNIMNGKS